MWIASRLYLRLGLYAEDKGLSTSMTKMLFVLDATHNLRRRPDVAFVSTTRWPLDRALPETGDWDVVPNLAVEVISPNDIVKDVLAKVCEYFHYRVQVIWVIAPEERQVYVYDALTRVRILTGQDELTGGEVVHGFRMPLGHLFQHAVIPRSLRHRKTASRRTGKMPRCCCKDTTMASVVAATEGKRGRA